jgi:aminopeptidase-like protein
MGRRMASSMPTAAVCAAEIRQQMYALIELLYPICRSITGDGVRQTLQVIEQYIPLDVHEVASGKQVFDWTVPKEWNVRDAYIKAPSGEKIVDFHSCNLHLLNYSLPIQATLSLSALKEHLFSLSDHPDWIPYRTSYYHETWGFCLPHKQLESLRDGDYEVLIDTTLEPGYLTYGECYLPGETTDEVLFSCHVCHPSLCNDNLSGVSLVTHLARYLHSAPRRYSYRFVFIPGTIGAITWLSCNQSRLANIKHGLVVACVGDPGRMHYKRSRRGDAEIDRAVIHTLRYSGQNHEILDFVPYGYDERQYCSPGFNLPIGSLTRTPHGRYPEYHTSADNLDFVRPEALADSFMTYLAVVELLETNRKYVNARPYGEPQLGKRGLYRTLGGIRDAKTEEMAMLWVLNMSDGTHALLDIADRAGLPYRLIKQAAARLQEHGLLEEVREQ